MGSYKRSEITKEQILSAATKLFLEKGYTATTIREICRVSGVSLSRVNYHFSSKAALANEICKEFLRNFYAQIRGLIGNQRRYSLMTESIAVHFLVELLTGFSGQKSALFYKDVVAEGILADAFTLVNNEHLSASDSYGQIEIPEQIEDSMDLYSRIFASALSAAVSGWDTALEQNGGDQQRTLRMMQHTFASLLLQMLDVPHELQNSIVDMAGKVYESVEVEMIGLTDVAIRVMEEMSE